MHDYTCVTLDVLKMPRSVNAKLSARNNVVI